MNYVLILLFVGSGATVSPIAVTTAYFQTRIACETAAENAKKHWGRYYGGAQCLEAVTGR